jgi:hypothetical protein
MRKTIVLVAAGLVMAVALVASAGCGGSTKSTTGSVSEADLGVPIYPGATKTDVNGGQPGPNSGMGQSAPGPPPNGGQGSAPNRMPQGSIPQQGRGSMTALWTADSTDKVTTWYRDHVLFQVRGYLQDSDDPELEPGQRWHDHNGGRSPAGNVFGYADKLEQ